MKYVAGKISTKQEDNFCMYFLVSLLAWIFACFIQHCFICRPSDSNVLQDAGIEHRTIEALALTIRRSNQTTRLDIFYNFLQNTSLCRCCLALWMGCDTNRFSLPMLVRNELCLGSPGIDSASLCSLQGRYDNPIPTRRFLAPINSYKIPAQGCINFLIAAEVHITDGF